MTAGVMVAKDRLDRDGIMRLKRVNRFEDVLPDLVKAIEAAGVKLVRIEGVMSAGKTPLAKMLAHELSASAVHRDCFQANLQRTDLHPDQLNLDGFRSHLQWCLDRSPATVVEGICLEELAPSNRFGRGFLIYIKRISQADLWHGFDDEDEPPDHEWHSSVQLYHSRHRPHERADFLIEVPEEGHCFSAPDLERA